MTEYRVKIDAMATVEAENKRQAERKCLGISPEWKYIETTEAWDAEEVGSE